MEQTVLTFLLFSATFLATFGVLMMGYYMMRRMMKMMEMMKMEKLYGAEKDYEKALSYYDDHIGDMKALQACYVTGDKYYHLDEQTKEKVMHKEDVDDLLDFYFGPQDEEMMIKEKIYHDIRSHKRKMVCDYPLTRVH